VQQKLKKKQRKRKKNKKRNRIEKKIKRMKRKEKLPANDENLARKLTSSIENKFMMQSQIH